MYCVVVRGFRVSRHIMPAPIHVNQRFYTKKHMKYAHMHNIDFKIRQDAKVYANVYVPLLVFNNKVCRCR